MIYIFFHAVGQYAPDRKPAWFLRLNPLGKVIQGAYMLCCMHMREPQC